MITPEVWACLCHLWHSKTYCVVIKYCYNGTTAIVILPSIDIIVALPVYSHLFAQEEQGLRLQPGLVTRDGHFPALQKMVAEMSPST